MWDATLTKVLLDILLVAVTGGIGLLTMYLKKKWGIEKSKDIMAKVMLAVQAAELIGAGLGWKGSEKKEWVINNLSTLLKIDAAQLDLFIEAAVSQLKAAGDELVKDTSANTIVLEYARLV
jgi:hypothetical protein